MKSVVWLPSSEGILVLDAFISFVMTLSVTIAFLSLEGHQVVKMVRLSTLFVRSYDKLFILECRGKCKSPLMLLHTWRCGLSLLQLHQSSITYPFEGLTLRSIAVPPQEEATWFVGAGYLMPSPEELQPVNTKTLRFLIG